jgi:hypothetical protein
MKSMISGYRHRPGEHCGSTALRNMLLHYCGLDLSEALTFGLGSGIDSIYLHGPDGDPEVVIFGRRATLESDLSEALGIDYVEEPEFDDERAWEKVRREIMEGMPTVICADTYYLDYRRFRVHFPFNRFVLVGFDDEKRQVHIHDRVNASPQPVSYEGLALARNPSQYPIYNLWGRFRSGSVRRTIEQACLLALKKAARRMTGQDDAQKKLILPWAEGKEAEGAAGLDGLKMFQEQLPTWRDKDNANSILSYASRTIEKFGSGGGNFRRLYAAFLEEARVMLPDVVDERLPALATRSADLWTSLSERLSRIEEEGDEGSWEASVDLIGQIIGVETDLFDSLLEKLPD